MILRCQWSWWWFGLWFHSAMIWCVMMTYTKTALVILGGAFVGLSGHDCHGFCGKNLPMQTLPSSNTTPTKKQKKNIQQRPTKNTTIQKSLNFFLEQVFHIPFHSQGSWGVQQRETWVLVPIDSPQQFRFEGFRHYRPRPPRWGSAETTPPPRWVPVDPVINGDINES